MLEGEQSSRGSESQHVNWVCSTPTRAQLRLVGPGPPGPACRGPVAGSRCFERVTNRPAGNGPTGFVLHQLGKAQRSSVPVLLPYQPEASSSKGYQEAAEIERLGVSQAFERFSPLRLAHGPIEPLAIDGDGRERDRRQHPPEHPVRAGDIVMQEVLQLRESRADLR